MDTAVRQRMGMVEFLAWEHRQEFRFEFDGFEPVAMTGGSKAHAAIERNLALALGTRLRGQRCAFFGGSLKVVTANRVRYPDGQVVCTEDGPGATFTTAPVMLFEVVSPSSVTTDHVDKLGEYQGIPSVLQYVVIEQDREFVTVHVRSREGWLRQTIEGPDTLMLPSLDLAVPVAELYEGLPVEPA